MNIFGFYNIVYRVIYIYIIGMCLWSVFTHKELQRQIGYAIVMVPFLLRILGLK
jgi:MFS-type transporter involved in bile tolerance (Atg22 family)